MLVREAEFNQLLNAARQLVQTPESQQARQDLKSAVEAIEDVAGRRDRRNPKKG